MPRVGLSAEKLTMAAADLSDRVGFDQLSLATLAKMFGVADASLYSHIANLADLRQRVAEVAKADIAEVLSESIAGRSGVDALSAFADAYRAFGVAHPGRYAATQIQPVPGMSAPGHERAGQVAAAVMRAYALAEPQATDAVRYFRSTLHGFILLELGGHFGDPRSLDASFGRIVAAIDSTLTGWEKP